MLVARTPDHGTSPPRAAELPSLPGRHLRASDMASVWKICPHQDREEHHYSFPGQPAAKRWSMEKGGEAPGQPGRGGRGLRTFPPNDARCVDTGSE